MTSSVGLLGVVADVVILLALVAAVASPSVSWLARTLIATFAFVCAWLLTAVFDALGAPGSTIFIGGVVIVVSIVVITVAVHLWTQGGDGGGGGPEPRADHGGGGPPRRRPDAPQHGGGGSNPSWWPEFERELALYVVERERDKRQPAVLSAEPAAYATRRPGRPHGVAKTHDVGSRQSRGGRSSPSGRRTGRARLRRCFPPRRTPLTGCDSRWFG